jgi:hypothetical protein
MTLSAGTRLGPYEVLLLLYAGQVREVYRPRDGRSKHDLRIEVALALLSLRGALSPA